MNISTNVHHVKSFRIVTDGTATVKWTTVEITTDDGSYRLSMFSSEGETEHPTQLDNEDRTDNDDL